MEVGIKTAPMTRLSALSEQVIDCAANVRKNFGFDVLDGAFENVLVHELRLAGFHVEQNKPCEILDDDNVIVGTYRADIVIDGKLMIEIADAASRSFDLFDLWSEDVETKRVEL